MFAAGGHEVPITAADVAMAAATKRRRGRQPRPCTLSGPARAAAAAFATSVGAPRVVEPAGFRDFVGWLQRLQSPAAADAWSRLLTALLADANGDVASVQRSQADVVREIIGKVVTIRQGESTKLVSTNARRQSARPEHGTTLMKIFDRALARATRSGQHTASASSQPVRPVLVHRPQLPASHRPSPAAGFQPVHNHRSHSHRPRASISGGGRRQPQLRLPSMQELEESLRRR